VDWSIKTLVLLFAFKSITKEFVMSILAFSLLTAMPLAAIGYSILYLLFGGAGQFFLHALEKWNGCWDEALVLAVQLVASCWKQASSINTNLCACKE
jgi:hypothetical protein